MASEGPTLVHAPDPMDTASRVAADPGAPPRALLSVTELTMRYDDTVAVDRLTFDVHEGEFFTLLGPSGCGKSTTLMAIAGFESPAGGRIALRGRDITHERPEARDMGVVFQSYALFPHLSVLENVAFPLRMRGCPRSEREARAREALTLVELPANRHHIRPPQLSGGQQQRVALARAMVFGPDVLLMDEPLSALDRRLRQTLQYELRELQARLNTTVIYVTHDQEEALVLSDRIAVMRDGRFEQVANPRTVYRQPATAFVANFLGNSNRLPVRVQRAGDAVDAVPRGADAPTLRVGGAPVAAGDHRLLVLRPENVRIVARDEVVGEAEGSCSATVHDTVFVGDHVRVEVEVAGAAWTVPLHHEREMRLGRLRRGDVVELAWRLTDAQLLDDGAPTRDADPDPGTNATRKEHHVRG